MAKYEITLVFDKDNKKIIDGFRKYFEELKVKVVKEEDWGVKPLAYPIKKREEAGYFYFEIEVDTKKIKKLEDKIKLEEGLLRYLVVRVK